jgi:4-amino-4-deoxy-L-arabinose transferase-like glycosyltransferase
MILTLSFFNVFVFIYYFSPIESFRTKAGKGNPESFLNRSFYYIYHFTNHMTINSHFKLKQFFSAPYLFLFATTFFLRFPFFFRDYIDRDESTFILIGKSITDGHLPYDFLWDLKPPLLFYVFGFVEWLFPHSLIAVRFFGVIIIFISAIVLIQIAKTVGAKNSFLIGLSYVLLSSLFGSIQGVMSEHAAVFFFLPGILLFLKNKTPVNLLLSGIFFGCAMLCKLNLAYTLLGLFLYYFIIFYKSGGLSSTIKNIALATTGTLIPFILIAIPYILQNKLKLFIESVFMATLEYGHTTKVTPLYKLLITGWVIMLSLLISILAMKFVEKENRKQAGLFIALLASTIFTFYSSGTVNGHYLIEIFPFLVILLFGFTLRKEFTPGYLKYAVLVLLLSTESFAEYYRIVMQYAEKSTFYNGKAFTAVHELKRLGLADKKIFFADHHIGYWLLNKYPLTKSVTHPSSLSRPEFFKHFGNTNTSLEELKCIMEVIDPEVIVSRKECLSFFSEDSEENIYFMSRMKAYYQLAYQNPAEKIVIWAKKPEHGQISNR